MIFKDTSFLFTPSTFFFNFVSTQRTMWRLIWTCAVGRCTLIVRNEILLRRIIHKNLWTYRDRNPPYSRERTMYSLLLWFKKKKSIILIISLQRESVASNCKPRHIILTTHKINFQIIKKKKIIPETRAPFLYFLAPLLNIHIRNRCSDLDASSGPEEQPVPFRTRNHVVR